MNVSEAAAVNVVCRALLGRIPAQTSREEPTEDQLVSALATLAERANRALQAGWSGGYVVARKQLVADLHAAAREARERHGH